MYTLGVDISKYQDNNNTPQKPDLQKLVDNGVKYLFVRAYNGSIEDEDFKYYWSEARRLGLLRGAYAFHAYGAGAKPTRTQANELWEIIKDDPGEIPPALDYERPNQNFPELPPRQIGLTRIQTWFDIMDTNYGKPCVFYSNPDCIKNNLRPTVADSSFLLSHPLWVAQYLYKVNDSGVLIQPVQQCTTIEDLRKRTPYRGDWKAWTFWQFTDRLDGLKFGMESRQLDGNVFNGSYEDLLAFCGKKEPTQLTLEERVLRLEKHCGIV